MGAEPARPYGPRLGRRASRGSGELYFFFARSARLLEASALEVSPLGRFAASLRAARFARLRLASDFYGAEVSFFFFSACGVSISALRELKLARELYSLLELASAGQSPERFSFSAGCFAASCLACQRGPGFQRCSANAEQRSCELAGKRSLVRICALRAQGEQAWPA